MRGRSIRGLLRQVSFPVLAALMLAPLALACASFGADGDPATDGGAGDNDGSAQSDCDLGLVLPSSATIGQELEVVAEVFPASLPGAREFEWSIDIAGAQQDITYLADLADRVSFTPVEAGPYQVVVNATVGGLTCTVASGIINVTALGALSKNYRMRVVPLTGAPFQDFSVRIFGGADTGLPTKVLEPGTLASGVINDAGGTGVPAYLRARMRGTSVQTDYEGFSNANGAFSLLLPSNGHYDLLVVPSGGSLPSLLLEDQEVSDLSTAIVLPIPGLLSGHVLGVGNVAVQGALVNLVIDGAATTSAVTAADGSFSVLGSAGQLSALRVAPATGSGMPALRAEGLSGQLVDGASDVIIRYSNAAVSAQVDVSLASGSPAVGALVEWRAQNALAATVNVGVSEDVAGSMRILATADGTGRAQASVAAVVADLAVQSSDANEARVQPALDWGTTPSRTLDLEALVPVSVAVTFAAAVAEGAQLLAMPLGSLAPQAAAASALVPGAGPASLSLVRGGDYELVAFKPGLGTRVTTITNVATGMVVSELELPPTLLASGEVLIEGNAAAGARVSLYCVLCSGDEATRALAQAVVNSTGKYELRVEDPGVAAP